MSQLLPYETIVKASEGDPEAVAAVLSHYAGYVRSCEKMDGQINTDVQEHIVRQLIESLLKFHFVHRRIRAWAGSSRRRRTLVCRTAAGFVAAASRTDWGVLRLAG